jgi:MurNAc alpha-1-phosphate uridylyltransferase
MVLAAGEGLRMRPLTLVKPKPLIEVAGKPLIEHGFDRLRAAGVTRAVVNVHYLPEQIEAWAARQANPTVTISDERVELLDTGGGVARALPLLGERPFFVINSDCFWRDGRTPALERLRAVWDAAAMDFLLLTCPLTQCVGYDGAGDFLRGSDGRLVRRKEGEGLAYVGAYLVHPRALIGAPMGKFSMNLLWDRAAARGRLFGIVHDGLWLHVGTSGAIAEAERALRERV